MREPSPSPFLQACRLDDRATLVKLLKADPRYIDDMERDGLTSVHVAILDHNLPLLEFLAQHDGDLKGLMRDENGKWISPVTLAAREGFLPGLSFLAEECRVHLQLESPDAAAALLRETLASKYDGVQTLNYFLGYKGLSRQPDVINAAFGGLPLVAHADMPPAVVEILLKNKLNPDMDFEDYSHEQSVYGGLPLIMAATVGAVENVRLYLRYGADPSLTNRHGKTAFDAIRELREECPGLADAYDEIESLLQDRIETGLVPPDERNQFIAACERGDRLTVRRLLLNKEDVNQIDNYGRAGIHIAMQTRNPGLLATLLEHGANAALPFHIDDKNEILPVELAIQNKFIRGIEIITLRETNFLWPSRKRKPGEMLIAAQDHVPTLRYLIEEKKLNLQKSADDIGMRFINAMSSSLVGMEYLLRAGLDINRSYRSVPASTHLQSDTDSEENNYTALTNRYNAASNLYDDLPLARAAFTGDVELVKLYLRYGAEPYRRNINGKSAWDAIHDKNNPFFRHHKPDYDAIELLILESYQRPKTQPRGPIF